MITEDYCGFEVSKLLKQKGFDLRDTKELYVAYKDGYCVINNPHTKHYPTDEFPKATYQMVLKWFREIHHIDICVCREIDEQGKCFDGYIAIICKDDCYKITIREATEDLTYEEATNKAIKYGLTLI